MFKEANWGRRVYSAGNFECLDVEKYGDFDEYVKFSIHDNFCVKDNIIGRLKLAISIIFGGTSPNQIFISEKSADKLVEYLSKKSKNHNIPEKQPENTDLVDKNHPYYKAFDATVVVLPVKDGKILLTKRLATKSYENFYAVPGGKLNSGEDPALGAARELLEETGIDIKNLERFELLEVTEEEPTSKSQFMFRIDLRPGEIPAEENPEPLKHTDWKFYKKSDALSLKLIPLLTKYIKEI